ncbi:unnamed protein product [Ambrosiozyma monospora]|uniref:Unnamed protein product n=1 Tax=Ambrosiozyma monospora TaxID=43982 RepID=A0ACB5U0C8_AMBMO|nr:unnamed protein product [Ambrosiozyma monospora]
MNKTSLFRSRNSVHFTGRPILLCSEIDQLKCNPDLNSFETLLILPSGPVPWCPPITYVATLKSLHLKDSTLTKALLETIPATLESLNLEFIVLDVDIESFEPPSQLKDFKTTVRVQQEPPPLKISDLQQLNSLTQGILVISELDLCFTGYADYAYEYVRSFISKLLINIESLVLVDGRYYAHCADTLNSLFTNPDHCPIQHFTNLRTLEVISDLTSPSEWLSNILRSVENLTLDSFLSSSCGFPQSLKTLDINL